MVSSLESRLMSPLKKKSRADARFCFSLRAIARKGSYIYGGIPEVQKVPFFLFFAHFYCFVGVFLLLFVVVFVLLLCVVVCCCCFCVFVLVGFRRGGSLTQDVL